MRPYCLSTMYGTMVLVQLKTPVRFTSMTCCHSSYDIFSNDLSRVIPALFIKMSIWPYCSNMARAAASRAGTSVILNFINSTEWPCWRSSWAVCSPASSISQRITFAPSRAKISAVARPMPRAPPVTMATLSVSLPIFWLNIIFVSSKKTTHRKAPR